MLHDSSSARSKRASAEVIFDLTTDVSRDRIVMSQAPITPRRRNLFSERVRAGRSCLERQVLRLTPFGAFQHPTLSAGGSHDILFSANLRAAIAGNSLSDAANVGCACISSRRGPHICRRCDPWWAAPSFFGWTLAITGQVGFPKSELHAGLAWTPLLASISTHGKGFSL
jgi:hypothetical protein